MTALGMLALLLVSAFVSGSETAVFSLAPAARRRLQSGQRASALLLAQPGRLLVTLLAANLLANVAYFTLSASLCLALQEAGRPGLSTAVAVGSLAGMVVFGEIVPKTLALVDPPRFVGLGAPVLVVVRGVLAPLVALGSALTRLLEAPLLGRLLPPREPGTREYKQALASGAAFGTYHPVELALLEDVVDVAERPARTRMVPRVDVAFLDLTEDRASWVATMAHRPHTDYPVVDGSADRLRGTINAVRFLEHPDVPREALVEPALLAPATLGAERLVLRMEEEGRRLAILLDEYGGVVGVVGLAELCHAVLGEIEPLADGLVERSGATFVVRGHCPVTRLAEDYGIELETRRADTVGGALTEWLGRLPRRGDEWRVPGWRLRVLDIRAGRVDRVALRPSLPGGGEAPA